mmetsp:Transcript_49943/g.161823  ORF Transcript_49943/g.161823 Transcript_49943/m.161823 type:complete len:275 (+) Transcript_49943:764-1588(+)
MRVGGVGAAARQLEGSQTQLVLGGAPEAAPATAEWQRGGTSVKSVADGWHECGRGGAHAAAAAPACSKASAAEPTGRLAEGLLEAQGSPKKERGDERREEAASEIEVHTALVKGVSEESVATPPLSAESCESSAGTKGRPSQPRALSGDVLPLPMRSSLPLCCPRSSGRGASGGPAAPAARTATRGGKTILGGSKPRLPAAQFLDSPSAADSAPRAAAAAARCSVGPPSAARRLGDARVSSSVSEKGRRGRGPCTKGWGGAAPDTQPDASTSDR